MTKTYFKILEKIVLPPATIVSKLYRKYLLKSTSEAKISSHI